MQKSGGVYRPVQDLQAVNASIEDIHPTIPNPYTLLSSLKPGQVWYIILDLKDALLSLSLAPRSQDLFAFEWTNSEQGMPQQLTWTHLSQGFKNSPTIFNKTLGEDLQEYWARHAEVTLLQYVDDLLLAVATQEE